MELIPAGFPEIAALSLIALSFFTSGIAAVFGIGGGSLLLAAMATVMPVATLIPLHGVVQLFSNAGRAALQVRHVDWSVMLPFILGTAIGSVVGGQLVVDIRDAVLKLLLAAFIIAVTWLPTPKVDKAGRWTFGLLGLTAAFVNMFVGATGPYVGAIVRSRAYDRMQVIGTHAACMTLQHGIKILVFGVLGFAFAPWLPFLIGMTVSGFAGTYAGTRLLGRMSNSRFDIAFRIVLTLAGLYLAVTALLAW